jgi:hypothetical protein
VKKILMALAVLMFAGAFWSQPAEARCWWNGFRWHCTHFYRHHWWYGYYSPYRHHRWWYAYYRPYRHHRWYGYYHPYRYYYRPYYYGYYHRPWVCVGPLCLG